MASRPIDEDVGLAGRVVEVLHNRGDDTSPNWSVGSGFVVRDGLVLTAAHVVGSTGELLVRFRGSEEWPARVCRLSGDRGAIDEQNDLAILEIIGDVRSGKPVAVARLKSDPTLDTPNLDDCSAFGFPRFQEKQRAGRDKPLRESVRIDGYIPMGQGVVEGIATLRIRDAPHDVPIPAGELGASLWQGISGAVVFAGGFAIGVISEHHPPAGTNALTVVPLAWLDRRADGRDWWALLGVADPATLPSLPANDRRPDAAQVSDAEVERRYCRLVRRLPEIEKLSTPFGGLSSNFYLPRLLRSIELGTGVGRGSAHQAPQEPARQAIDVVTSVHRLVIVAGAGMGKTQLLHDVARRMTAGECPGIPLFIRLHDFARRAGSLDLLAFGVQESLGGMLGHDEVHRTVTALRRRAEERGDLVFLLDGLDEVPVAQQEDVVARLRNVQRFVLTSRPMGRIDVLQDSGATYQLEELTDEAVVQFIDHWATAHEPEARGLMDRLADDPALTELGRLPQLLTLLCMLWRPMPATGSQNKIEILSNAVEEAFNRAARLSHLSGGDEEVVPLQARRALRRAALESVGTGEGRQLRFSREHLLELMSETGGSERAGTLLGFARRTGLMVQTRGPGNELEFLHHMFRAFLAGEALAADADPAPHIDRLKRKVAAEDPLVVAAALDPERMPALILDRVAADDQDIFRMNWRLAALCMEGVPDLRSLDHSLRSVTDAVLASAREWWSRDRFTPVIGSLRTAYMRSRLLQDLDHEDGYARWAAVDGLKYLGEPEAVPALIDRLSHEQWQAIQQAIVIALARFRDPSAIGPLWEYYERRSRAKETYTDFYAVGEGLGRLGAEPELRQLILWLKHEPSAADALVGALPFVRPSLADEIVSALAANQITLTRPEDQRRYLADLRDEATTVERRLNAINGLGDAGTGEAAGALLGALVSDTSDVVRDRAAHALLDLSGTPDFVDVVQDVVDRLQSPETSERDNAAVEFLALWTSPAQEGIGALIFPEPDAELDSLLTGCSNPRIRATAAILGALGGAPPRAALLELIDNDDAVVREAAIAAAGRAAIGEATNVIAGRIRMDRHRRVRIAALHALGSLAPAEALVVLTAALDASDAEERLAAAVAIGRLGDAAALPLLARHLNDEESLDVRIELIQTVSLLCASRSATSDVARVLLGALDSAQPGEREAAAHALGEAGLVESASRLRSMMAFDPSETVRSAAAKAYGRVASVDALVALADEILATTPSQELMEAVATALGNRTDVIRPLRERVSTTGGGTIVSDRGVVVRYPTYTYTIIRRNEPHELGELFDALADNDPDRRWGAVDELADHWTREGVLGRLGLAMLDDDECVADHAGSILEDLADEYFLQGLDTKSAELLGEERTMLRLIGLLDRDSSSSRGAAWLLAHIEFVPGLLRALMKGQRSVRQILWDVANRYEVRLLAEGRAILPSGQEVHWDDLATSLRQA